MALWQQTAKLLAGSSDIRRQATPAACRICDPQMRHSATVGCGRSTPTSPSVKRRRSLGGCHGRSSWQLFGQARGRPVEARRRRRSRHRLGCRRGDRLLFQRPHLVGHRVSGTGRRLQQRRRFPRCRAARSDWDSWSGFSGTKSPMDFDCALSLQPLSPET